MVALIFKSSPGCSIVAVCYNRQVKGVLLAFADRAVIQQQDVLHVNIW